MRNILNESIQQGEETKNLASDIEGWPNDNHHNSPHVDADGLASRLRFNPDFAIKLADAITPDTTVIVTDQPAIRKPILDSTVFAN